MEVYDAPLNLAHQQARKAEVHLACAKYDDAIECHQKAAEFLSQAVDETSSTTALDSLNLQKEYHLRQIEIVKSKKSTDEKDSNLDEKITSNDGMTSPNDDRKNPDNETDRIYRTMDQCDTLLCHLEKRQNRVAKNEQQRRQFYQTAVKVRKDDKQVIEELVVHNESLQGHVLLLLHECERRKEREEALRKENEQLRLRAEELGNSKRRKSPESLDSKDVFDANDLDIDLGSLELPPLEMPKFDFEFFSDVNLDDQN